MSLIDKINNWFRTKNNTLLFFYSIIWIILLIFIPLTFWYLENAFPFPEKFFVHQMNQDMIDLGEDKVLINIYLFSSICIFAFALNLVLSPIVVYKLLIKNKISFKQYIYIYIYITNNKVQKILNFFLLFLIYFAFILFGFLLIPYLWLINIKAHNPYRKCLNFVPRTYKLKSTRWRTISWSSVAIASPVIVASTSLIVYFEGNMPILFNIPNENVNKALTLSNNQTNVIQLYFDRVPAMAWNLLLMIDYYKNKDNSFIKLFPEFDSFTNTLSTSNITIFSNPVIYSGFGFNPLFKETKSMNKLIDKCNSDITQNGWYFNAFKNLVSMLKYNNVEDVVFSSIPYYGNSKSLEYGNVVQLENDFKKENIQNVYGITNEKIANYKDSFHLKNYQVRHISDAYTLQHLPNWIEFNSTSKNKFVSYFSQATHEDYVFLDKNNNFQVGKLSEANHIKSMWTTIQLLKPFLLKLKQTPFLANGKPDGSSVYDHSLISIISDHGIGREYTPVDNLIKELTKYNNKLFTKEQINYLSSFDYYSFNPLMMYKRVGVKRNNFNFDSDKIISLGDHARILEIELNKVNNFDSSTNKSFFNQIDWYEDEKIRTILQKSILSDPLNSQFNSIKNNQINNREITLVNGKTWRFKSSSKTFYPSKITQFSFNKDNKTFFNNNNFKLIRK